MLCYCRKCDSNELKGSASTSLMKAIIQSNNVGATIASGSHTQPVSAGGLPGTSVFMPTSANFPSKPPFNAGSGARRPMLSSSLPQPNQDLSNMAMMSGECLLVLFF